MMIMEELNRKTIFCPGCNARIPDELFNDHTHTFAELKKLFGSLRNLTQSYWGKEFDDHPWIEEIIEANLAPEILFGYKPSNYKIDMYAAE